MTKGDQASREQFISIDEIIKDPATGIGGERDDHSSILAILKRIGDRISQCRDDVFADAADIVELSRYKNQKDLRLALMSVQFRPNKISKYKQIGKNTTLCDPANRGALPPEWTILYELSLLNELALTAAIAAGTISPTMKMKDAKGLRPQTRKYVRRGRRYMRPKTKTWRVIPLEEVLQRPGGREWLDAAKTEGWIVPWEEPKPDYSKLIGPDEIVTAPKRASVDEILASVFNQHPEFAQTNGHEEKQKNDLALSNDGSSPTIQLIDVEPMS
jgi:hypothetical protein